MSSLQQRELAWFVDRLRELQKRNPFSVTSWWRTPETNAEVGGKSNSLHLEGLAVDCVLEPGRSKGLFARDARILGLHVIIEGDHVRVQARARGVPGKAV
jgi:hypothetical protein